MSGLMEFVASLAGFLADPGPTVVIVLTWFASPLITFAGMQRLKRLAYASGCAWTPIRVELTATFASCAISLAIMHGLYLLPLRTAIIHAGLIAWCYMVAVRWWLAWARSNRPQLYDALRTRRRLSDFDETDETMMTRGRQE